MDVVHIGQEDKAPAAPDKVPWEVAEEGVEEAIGDEDVVDGDADNDDVIEDWDAVDLQRPLEQLPGGVDSGEETQNQCGHYGDVEGHNENHEGCAQTPDEEQADTLLDHCTRRKSYYATLVVIN